MRIIPVIDLMGDTVVHAIAGQRSAYRPVQSVLASQSTPDGIGYAKDPIGAKPMVVFETDRMVAVASEEVSLRQLFGHEIETFEPYPGTSHTWSRSTPANLVSVT